MNEITLQWPFFFFFPFVCGFFSFFSVLVLEGFFFLVNENKSLIFSLPPKRFSAAKNEHLPHLLPLSAPLP